jgi:hypothetical protein
MRIEIPVHYDLWMRGARFGDVRDYKKDGTWMVKMDHPQVKRLVRIPPADQEFCKVISMRGDI